MSPETGIESELFDAAFLSHLRLIFFKLRRRRRLQRAGIQAAPISGFTREFKDHRHYTPGDDYRAIDWRLFARLERLFVRIYEQVQEYHVHIVLDRSGSMLDPHPDKRMTALRLAVALAYLGLVNRHRVSLVGIGDDVARLTPPMRGEGHIQQIIRHMAHIEFGGTTRLDHCLMRFRPGRDRRGIVFVISDLFGQHTGQAEQALRHAATWPAETHVIHVIDPLERRPTLAGELKLIDVETNEQRRLWLSPRQLDQYRRSFDSFMDRIKRTCTRRQVNYVPWMTDQAFEEMFIALLTRGSALARS